MPPRIAIGMGECWEHKGQFGYNPETVVRILIDPMTAMPPDLDAQGRRKIVTPEVRARSIQVVVCDPCVARANLGRAKHGLPPIPLSTQRGHWSLEENRGP